MILPGHLAAAYMAGEALQVDRHGYWSAAMFPDYVDKPVRWLLGITPNDRIPAHSLTALALTALLARRLGGRRFASGWVVGYTSHLLCDELNARISAGRVYWLWPWKRYVMHRGPTGLKSSLADFSKQALLIEVALTLLGAILWLGRPREGVQSSTQPAP